MLSGPSTTTDDLAAVIDSIGEPGPWVLVGHSLGGIYARLFQRRHPELTAGLVLVDSSHEEMLDRMRAEIGTRALAGQVALGLVMTVAPRSVLRLVAHRPAADRVLTRLVGGETAAERQRRAALYLTSAFRRAQLAELVAVPGLLRDLRSGRRDLGSLPVAVVTAADPPPDAPTTKTRFRTSWVAMQDDLASLSTRSTRITADTGGHFVHADDPKAVLGGLDWVLGELSSKSA